MCYNLWVWISIVWLPTCAIVGNGEFVTTPSNALVYVGDSTTLKCTVINAGESDYIQAWREYITNPGGKVIARDNVPLEEKYEIVGQFNLKIKAAELGDGGTYSCEEALHGQITFFVDLVVLESDPVLSSSISSSLVLENVLVSYTCEVTYQGKFKPVIQWTNANGDQITANEIGTSGAVETSITVTADPSKNGDYFVCTTNIEDIVKTHEDQAVNPILYTDRIQTDTLEVHYKPRQTKITDLYDNTINRGSNIFAGTQIRCQSESNPPVARYEWRNTRNSQVLSTDAILSLGEELVGDVSLQCFVTNHMGEAGLIEGTDTVVISFNVIAADNSGSEESDNTEKPLSNGEIIGIALGVAVFLAIVIVVTIICVHKRKQKFRRKTITEDIRINEEGEEEVIRRHTEIVEPAAIMGTFSPEGQDDEQPPYEEYGLNNASREDNNNPDHDSSSQKSTVSVDSKDGREPNVGHRQHYINNEVTKYADEDYDQGPNTRRGNLEYIL